MGSHWRFLGGKYSWSDYIWKDGPGNDGEHKLDMGSLEHLKKIKFDS